jgi:exopolysaccharide biosynthesis WecB/TagA/CpsF family protein
MNKTLPKQFTTTTSIDDEAKVYLNVMPEKRQYFFSGRKKSRQQLAGKHLSLSLLDKLTLIHHVKGALDKVPEDIEALKEPFVISFVNAHCFNVCHSDQEFFSAILRSDLVFRDGKGIEILCNSLNVDPGVNMCGTDFIPVILQAFKNNSLALLGTTDQYVSKAADGLRIKGHKVVLFKNGFLPIEEYVDSLQELQPKIILLGMGMPRQEHLSMLLKNRLSYGCIIINGGAIIDHLGEKVSRAPLWIRKRGLEWLFRLLQEPRRLFKRYVVGNVLFLYQVFKAAGTIKIK